MRSGFNPSMSAVSCPPCWAWLDEGPMGAAQTYSKQSRREKNEVCSLPHSDLISFWGTTTREGVQTPTFSFGR